MKPLLLLLAAAATGEAYLCDFPTNGCSNGMFNQLKCECECIPPFCLDVYGDCLNPTSSCGGNPWTLCTRGVDCPWYSNPMKTGACTTGPEVPADIWDVYNTRDVCCSKNFPYSESCDFTPNDEVGPPTKHPTIAAPDDDDFEVVPIKFDIGGLPDGISIRELKDEMLSVMTRILLRMSEKIPNMKISSVEEKVVLQRNLIKVLRERILEEDVTLYYNVNVVRVAGRQFGALIINEMRASRSEILYEIQSFTDTNFFGGGDLDMNWCTSQNGKYELCVTDVPPPRPERAPTPVYVQGSDSGYGDGDSGDGDGLAGWAVGLIIVFVLLLLCCIGYAVYASFFKYSDENKEIHNNIYMDDGSGYNSRGMPRDRNLAIMDDRSRVSGRSRRSRHSQRTTGTNNDGSVQLILSDPQYPKFDDDSFTVDTYATRSSKPGRDPTMYIPGQEDRPDPDSGGRSIGSRRYVEDPPLKPKRDPTMFVKGQRDPTRYMEDQRDPSIYMEGQRDPTMYMDDGQYSAADPPLKPGRDPTMYVSGQQDPSIYDDATVDYSLGRSRDNYGSDPYGMGGIDEGDEYDDYGFKHGEPLNETNAEYARGARDPSYFDDPKHHEASFRTQEPSVSGRSKRSKGKKSRR